VDDEVHAVGGVEEPLDYQVVLGRHDAQHPSAGGHVVDLLEAGEDRTASQNAPQGELAEVA
jgi:hypothetical protein